MIKLLINEVQKEISKEKFNFFIIKYYKHILTISIIFIFYFIFNIWFKHYNQNEIYKDGSDFIKIMLQLESKNINYNYLESDLKKLSKRRSNYNILAKLYLAYIYSKKADYNNAIAIYDSISCNKKNDIFFRDLSKILSINLKIYLYKDKNNEMIINELKKYIATNPIYLHTAQILYSSLLIKNNMFNEAKEILNILLTNQNIGYNTRQIAKLLSFHIHE